jgi:zinc transporter ZupT
MLASLTGVLAVWFGIGSWLEKHLGYVTSFAAGVFLIVALQLVRHTLHNSATVWWPLIFIVIGALVVYGLFAFVPLFHHHHQEECETHDQLEIRRILFSDGLHNIGDGLLLVAAFQVSFIAGITAGIAVFIHELVQEVSEFFVLKASGLSTIKALSYNFLVSSTILIGVFGGELITNQQALRTPLLGIAAGSFLVVVIYDFIPHSMREAREKADIFSHAGWFLGGALLMTASLLVLGH